MAPDKETLKRRAQLKKRISADDIRHLRTEILNQTQQEFAYNIGVTKGTIRNWETGDVSPSGATLEDLLAYLNDLDEDFDIETD